MRKLWLACGGLAVTGIVLGSAISGRSRSASIRSVEGYSETMALPPDWQQAGGVDLCAADVSAGTAGWVSRAV